MVKKILPDQFLFEIKMRKFLKKGEKELKLIPLICRKNQYFVDVGANLGAYTYAAMKYSSHVYAIEPHPQLAHLLKKRFQNKITVLESALSDRNGQVKMYVPQKDGQDIKTRNSLEIQANPGYSLNHINVEMVKLDDLNLNNIAAIKIDVEGHEMSTLKGSLKVLKEQKPTVLVEVEKRHNPHKSHQVFELLQEHGYRGYFMMDNELKSLECFDFEQYQKSDQQKIPGQKRSSNYINNFLFVHKTNQETINNLSRSKYIKNT